MGTAREGAMDAANEAFERKLANYLGMTQPEFDSYKPELNGPDENGDGYYQFPENLPDDIANKIGADENKCVRIHSNDLDNIDLSDDPGIDDYTGPEDLRNHPKLPGLED